ncbi:hypothetical protein LY56_03501 [Roseinatronobacter thiooxidans]|uniref:Uncharacterized protein n=1 Tax=Roseinatronobacter thiooxidans TaxID=121821 RepID=A0A2W7PLM9_9RHOB|nr:hypothetical protein [Roseinatronobacter thiooxidans]PZX36243.1 hypothetical protein LY56_03501 [Roseinatronobacter thiooxidans]
MSLDLANYEAEAREAVKLFWGNREAALAGQIEPGNQDTGARGAVTAGKNMDALLAIAQTLIEANGRPWLQLLDNRPRGSVISSATPRKSSSRSS